MFSSQNLLTAVLFPLVSGSTRGYIVNSRGPDSALGPLVLAQSSKFTTLNNEPSGTPLVFTTPQDRCDGNNFTFLTVSGNDSTNLFVDDVSYLNPNYWVTEALETALKQPRFGIFCDKSVMIGPSYAGTIWGIGRPGYNNGLLVAGSYQSMVISGHAYFADLYFVPTEDGSCFYCPNRTHTQNCDAVSCLALTCVDGFSLQSGECSFGSVGAARAIEEEIGNSVISSPQFNPYYHVLALFSVLMLFGLD